MAIVESSVDVTYMIKASHHRVIKLNSAATTSKKATHIWMTKTTYACACVVDVIAERAYILSQVISSSN